MAPLYVVHKVLSLIEHKPLALILGAFFLVRIKRTCFSGRKSSRKADQSERGDPNARCLGVCGRRF